MAEEIKVPAGIYDMVTRCMEQEFPDNVAIRYVAAAARPSWKRSTASTRRTSAG